MLLALRVAHTAGPPLPGNHHDVADSDVVAAFPELSFTVMVVSTAVLST